jgi:hypothetical protein
MLDEATGGSRGNTPADIQIYEYVKNLPKEEQDKFFAGRWKPDYTNFGGFRMNPVTGQRIATTMTPDQRASITSDVRSFYNSPEQLSTFALMGKNTGQDPYMLQQQAIASEMQRYGLDYNGRPIEGAVGAPPAPAAQSALPQAAATAAPAAPAARAAARASYLDDQGNFVVTTPDQAKAALDDGRLSPNEYKLITDEMVKRGTVDQATVDSITGRTNQTADRMTSGAPARSALPAAVAATNAPIPNAPAASRPLVTSSEVKGQETAATKQAEATVAEKTTREQRARDAIRTMDILGQADAIFGTDNVTGSGFGNSVVKGVQQFIGYSSDKTRNDAQLKTLGDLMVQNVPRFEGPQSDRDVDLYKSMAGDLGNAAIPVEDRYAKLQTLRRMNENYIRAGIAGDPLTDFQLIEGGGVTTPGIKSDGTLDPTGQAELERLRAKRRAEAARGR